MSQSVTIRGTPAEVQERMVTLFERKPPGSLICLSMTAPIVCDLHCFFQGIRGDEGRQFCAFRTLVGECIAAGILLPRCVAGIEFPYPPNAHGLIEVTVTVETTVEFAWADATLSNYRCHPWDLLTLAQFRERTGELKEISDRFADRLDEVQAQARARSEARCEDVEQLRSDIAQLQGSLAVVIAERDAFRFQLGGANEHIAHMRNSLAEASTRSIVAQAAPSSEPSTAVILLQQRLEDTLRDLNEAAQLGLTQAQEITALRKQVYDREAKLTTVTVDLRAKESLVAAWETKCNTANATIAALNQRLEARSEASYSPPPRSSDASLEHDLARAEKTIITQRERIEASERTAERALQAKRAAESRAEDRVALLDAERRDAEKRVGDLTAQLETAKRELKIKRDTLDTVETEARTLRTQVQQLHAERDAVRPADRQDVGEVRRLRVEVDELKRQLITADAAKLAATRAFDDESAALDKARAKANDLFKQLTSQQGEHDALVRKYRRLEDDLAEATAELEQRRLADDTTRTVPKPRVTVAADFEPERAKLKKRVAELEAQTGDLLRQLAERPDDTAAPRNARPARDGDDAAVGCDHFDIIYAAAAKASTLGPSASLSASGNDILWRLVVKQRSGEELTWDEEQRLLDAPASKLNAARRQPRTPWNLADWPALTQLAATSEDRVTMLTNAFQVTRVGNAVVCNGLYDDLTTLITAYCNILVADERHAQPIVEVFERALADLQIRAAGLGGDAVGRFVNQTGPKPLAVRIDTAAAQESDKKAAAHVTPVKKKPGGRGRGGGGGGSPGGSPGLSSSVSSATPTKQGNGKGGGQSA